MNHTVQVPRSPTHWWDETKYPTITIGPLSFPGTVLPFLIAFIFVFYKTSPEQLRRAREPAQRQHARARRDRFRNPDNLPADAPDLQHYAGNTLSFFHNFCMQHAWFRSIHSNNPSETISPQFCYLQAAALSIGGAAFGQPSSLIPCLSTALGWLALGMALPMFFTDLYLVAIALVALPCTLTKPGTVRIGELHSAVGLLTLACDGLLPITSPIRSPQVFPGVETWRLIPIFATSFARWFGEKVYGLLDPSPVVRETARQRSITSTIIRNFSTSAQEALLITAKAIAFFGPVVLAAVISAFNLSCLPWKHVILGRGSEPPAATPESLFITAGPVIWAFALLQRRDQRRRAPRPALVLLQQTALHAAEAVGCTVTGFAALWITLS